MAKSNGMSRPGIFGPNQPKNSNASKTARQENSKSQSKGKDKYAHFRKRK